MLELRNLHKQYGRKKALQEVSLTILRGEIVGIFGENGAGKTTLMKSVLGLISHGGEVLLDGEPLRRAQIEKLSFATCEHSFFPNLTANGHREFYKEQFPKFREKRFEALMDFFSLPVNQRIGRFSTGQKNQFEVVLALCQGADYILMDEPFAGNDVFNREDFYKVLLGILEPDETVLLSTHLLEEVKPFLSRAILLHQGQLVGDVTMAELEEQNIDLMQYVKEVFQYRGDRVAKALGELTKEE